MVKTIYIISVSCFIISVFTLAVSLAPFVPSKPDVVKRMLKLADADMDDVVFDLGCGDARILISSVRDFGAKKAVGYEVRRDLFQKDLQEIKKEGLENKIVIVNGDLLEADISEATIITLYLTTSGNIRLKPKLAEEAKIGARIVSHDFPITGWAHSDKESFGGHSIYLYKIPEAFKKRDERHFLFSFRKKLPFLGLNRRF